MLQLTLARDHLLCGYGTQMDPSRDLALSGQAGDGCRPQLFFGPSRDALHLLTRKLHAALIVRPHQLDDLEPRVWVLALPGGDPAVTALWREQTEALGQQLKPLVCYGQWQQSETRLESDADVYHQLLLPRAEALPAALKALRLRITAGIEADALREEWQLEGLPQDWSATLAYWFQPEIGASAEFQSSLFYEPARALAAYRGAVCFGLQAQIIGKGQSLPVAFADTGSLQHGLAATRWGEILRSTWARDEALGFGHQGQHPASKPWLALEPRGLLSLGAADALILWQVPTQGAFELQFRLTKNLQELTRALPALDWNRLRKIDQDWVKKQKSLPAGRSTKLQDLYARTLLTLKQMQDPEGGIIAAPEFHYELTHCGGYGYCWGRDAGFISFAMDVCGMHEESAYFYRYMERCQSEDGSFLHRHDMAGHLGASWGLLQPDETGSVLFGLWQHYRLAKQSQVVRDLQPMIQKAADWLAQAQHSFDPTLPIEGFDLWEEREGVHLYTVASMAAGLESACELFRAIEVKVPAQWTQRAAELRALCLSPRFVTKEKDSWTFARTLRRRVPAAFASRLEQMDRSVTRHRSEAGRQIFELDGDYVADISQLAISYPYDIADKKTARAQLEALVEGLYARLWRPGSGGIGRYEADHYRDGNPWILCTLWLSLAAAELGKTQIAKTTWQWVLDHMPAEGMLPEQIDPVTGKPSWVMPLTWSHAMFALALHQLPEEVIG